MGGAQPMLTVAIAQIESDLDATEKNLARHLALVAKAREAASSACCFPETSLRGLRGRAST